MKRDPSSRNPSSRGSSSRGSSSRRAGIVLATLWIGVSTLVPSPTPLVAAPQQPLEGEGPTTATSSGALPPAAVVRQVRSARIAEERGDLATAVATLRRTLEDYPDSLVVVEALLAMAQRGGIDLEEQSALLEIFSRRLEEPGRKVSTAILTYLVQSPGVGDEVLRQIADRLLSEISEESSGGTPGEGSSGAVDPRRLELLVEVQRRLGDEAASLASLERLFAATGWERLLWPLHVQHAQAGNWERAAEIVGQMVAGGSVGLRTTWVELLARAGRTEAMLEQLAVLESEGWTQMSAPRFEELAWYLLDAGERQAAEPLFRRAADLPDANPQIRTALLHLYGSESDRLAQAEEDAAAWQTEEDPQILFEEGTQRLTVGDAEGAIGLLERAAQGMPQVEAAWYNLGLSAYRLERWEIAAKAFGKAAELNGRRSQNHLYLGIALVELERCSEAVGALENVVGMDPAQSLAHYHLSSCYRRLGEQEAADAAWQRYQESRSQN